MNEHFRYHARREVRKIVREHERRVRSTDEVVRGRRERGKDSAPNDALNAPDGHNARWCEELLSENEITCSLENDDPKGWEGSFFQPACVPIRYEKRTRFP